MRSTPPRTVDLLREFSAPLIAGVIAALIWANVDHVSYHNVIDARLIGPITVEFLVNELFMTFFFGIAAVAITDSLMRGGSLNPPRKAVAALLATAGGVICPVGVYLLLNRLFGGPELDNGWGIGTATDIALAWLAARYVFGKGHPAVVFLLLLAITDDLIGLAIIAVFYPDPVHAVRALPLSLVAAGMLVSLALRRGGVRRYWPYLLLGGVPSWLGLYAAHLHPALALVVVVPFMPHRRRRQQETVFEVAAGEHSTLSLFERQWKPVVDFGLFFFGLANAGVPFATVGPATWLVLGSLAVGKTGGVYCFGRAAEWAGFSLPAGMRRAELLLVGMVAGIGLTVSLFIAGAAFSETAIQHAAKMGALGSIVMLPLALAVRRVVRRNARRGQVAESPAPSFSREAGSPRGRSP